MTDGLELLVGAAVLAGVALGLLAGAAFGQDNDRQPGEHLDE